MKKLLVFISVVCLLIPAMALSEGNPTPHLYLEIFEEGVDNCICLGPPVSCFYDGYKANYVPCYVYVHIGKVPNGFLGIPFGMTSQNTSVFLSSTACPGFLKGPSTAGEPAAIIVSSTELCHPWQHHPIYCMWQAKDALKDYFDLTASADLGHNNVINCDNEYDTGTTIAGNAQWIGPQDIVCGDDPTPVELTTWGAIKGLYR